MGNSFHYMKSRSIQILKIINVKNDPECGGIDEARYSRLDATVAGHPMARVRAGQV